MSADSAFIVLGLFVYCIYYGDVLRIHTPKYTISTFLPNVQRKQDKGKFEENDAQDIHVMTRDENEE
jgi:hypothetical protein